MESLALSVVKENNLSLDIQRDNEVIYSLSSMTPLPYYIFAPEIERHPVKRNPGEIFFSFDMHGVTQDRTVVSVTESLTKQFNLKQPWLFHLRLFGEIPEEFKFQVPQEILDQPLDDVMEMLLSDEQRAYLENDKGISDTQHITNAFKSFGYSNEESENLGEEVFKQYIESISLNEEILPVVKELRKEGYVVGITTDRLRLAFAAAQERYLKDYFDSIIVSSHETGYLKSYGTYNFDKYVKKLSKHFGYEIKPGQIIHVDDGIKNNANARLAGMNTLFYEWNKEDKKHENSDIVYFLGRLYAMYGIELKFE